MNVSFDQEELLVLETYGMPSCRFSTLCCGAAIAAADKARRVRAVYCMMLEFGEEGS